jgi:hypothetical protein
LLLFFVCCVAAVTGPGARGLLQLGWSGGVLANTTIDLLLSQVNLLETCVIMIL